jgi:pimeloyl-ACP methyl ester carboxylesterase
MPYVPVNDIDLYYEESGTPDAPPLVLMHGGSGSLDDAEASWSALAPSFAEHYRVLALEHRGHGHTGNPAGRLGYDLLASDLRAFVDALELGPVHFAGLSDGGITGLYLALESPEILSSLVCVGTNFRVDEPIREALRNAEPETAERLFPEWAADLARRHDRHHGDGYWRELMRQIVAMASTTPDFTETDLARITTPALSTTPGIPSSTRTRPWSVPASWTSWAATALRTNDQAPSTPVVSQDGRATQPVLASAEKPHAR